MRLERRDAGAFAEQQVPSVEERGMDVDDVDFGLKPPSRMSACGTWCSRTSLLVAPGTAALQKSVRSTPQLMNV
jgi:hypothetical protein